MSSSGPSHESTATFLYWFLQCAPQWMARFTCKVQSFTPGRGCLCSFGSSHLSLRRSRLVSKKGGCNRGMPCWCPALYEVGLKNIYDVWIWNSYIYIYILNYIYCKTEGMGCLILVITMNQQHVIQCTNWIHFSEGKQLGNIIDIKLDHDPPLFFRLPPRQHEQLCVFKTDCTPCLFRYV